MIHVYGVLTISINHVANFIFWSTATFKMQWPIWCAFKQFISRNFGFFFKLHCCHISRFSVANHGKYACRSRVIAINYAMFQEKYF